MSTHYERGKALYDAEKYAEALPLLLQAARQEKNAEARFLLGRMYERGNGAPRNVRHADKWYRKAADLGHTRAQVYMGLEYEYGFRGPQDHCQAVKWYRKAAEQGYADAQNHLGAMYAGGRGVPQNDHNAVLWLQKAADQGEDNVNALYLLTEIYVFGDDAVRNYEKAFSILQKLADSGEAQAQYRLGSMYELGYGVSQDDCKAVELYRKAADQEDADAQFSLGLMYEDGLGAPQDDRMAFEWYQKAAGQNNMFGQYLCGLCYAGGRGVPQDDGMALHYFQKAAAQGHEEALARIEAVPFPLPPIPGNAHIQPLINDSMLWEEGRTMRHCVGRYAGAVRRGECYIYKVLEPARATVGIRLTDHGQWEAYQIKGYHNAKPTPDVLAAVREWLKPYNQSLSRKTPQCDDTSSKNGQMQYPLPFLQTHIQIGSNAA